MLSESAYGGDGAPSAGVVFPPPGTQPGNTPQPNWPYSPSQPTPNPTPEAAPGTGYRWPAPPQFIPGQPINPGDYFPEGLGPTTPPQPQDYPGGKKDPGYIRDRKLWEQARAIYDAHVRRSRTPRAKPYERGGAGGGGTITP
jgi:hypothetical protein